MFGSLLALGFLLGLRHSLEADHVAAVASLSTRTSSRASVMRVAAAWGVGHAATLIVAGAVLAALHATLPPAVGLWLERAVGLMLVLLGVDVLRRWRRGLIHFHAHAHDGGLRHLHGHAHRHLVAHDARAAHEHAHAARLLPRAVLVGSVHGLAGSAALLLVAIPAVRTAGRAVVYLLVFGAGSIAGMVLFSLALSLPLALSARRLGRAPRALEAAVGVLNVVLGTWIAVH